MTEEGRQRMTNKQAIEQLKWVKKRIAHITYSPESFNALNLAIKALEDSPQGEWINHRNDYGHNIADCSICGKTMQWHDEDEDGIPRYCWYCGADMRKERKNETDISENSGSVWAGNQV